MNEDMRQWLEERHQECIHLFNEQSGSEDGPNAYSMAFWNGAAVALKEVLLRESHARRLLPNSVLDPCSPEGHENLHA